MADLNPYPPAWWDHPVARDWMVSNMMEFRRTELAGLSFEEGNRIVRDVLDRLEAGCNMAGYSAPDWVLRARALIPADERSEWLARTVDEFAPDGLEGEPFKVALSRILDGMETVYRDVTGKRPAWIVRARELHLMGQGPELPDLDVPEQTEGDG